jgi:hypothetical protein
MFSLKRRAIPAVVALCLLAALAGGVVGDCFHTHDGSLVETHCLACQRQLNSVAVFSPHLAAPPSLEPVGTAVAPPTLAPIRTPVRSEASRGPPQV